MLEDSCTGDTIVFSIGHDTPFWVHHYEGTGWVLSIDGTHLVFPSLASAREWIDEHL